MKSKLKELDEVKVIGGTNEIGQPTMIGKIGVVASVEEKSYKVKGKDTYIVYVDFKHFGHHCFNDYHLQINQAVNRLK